MAQAFACSTVQEADVREHAEQDANEQTVARPLPSSSIGDSVRAWVDWFGLARLITSAIAVVVVCVGAWWLVRPSAPPSEAALPVASASAIMVTLPPPTTGVVGVAALGGSSPGTTASLTVTVHVAGAVNVPGVYELAVGSRVDEAVSSAGGPTIDAEMGRVNLAAPLVDGSQVYLPTADEEVGPAALPLVVTPLSIEPAGPVDVNRATAAQLEMLPGVGPTTAAAIVTERGRNGPFVSVAELDRVPGIGPAKLAALDGLIAT
ncbi:MAG: competence protein ComEA [Candidatus Aldehydirespiratoraceae bacterium]